MMPCRRLLSILALSLLTAGVCWGQAPFTRPGQAPTQSPTTGRLDSAAAEHHKLVPGDQLQLTIDALEDSSIEQIFTVRADGTIDHPVIRELRVVGRTTKDLRPEILARLTRYLRNPSFRLGLHAVAKQSVSVLGEVRSQGTHEVDTGSSVLDVLAKCGGLTEKADPDRAVLQRGSERIILSLKPQLGGEPPIEVRSGDILYVLEGVSVSVSGEVMKPGVYGVSQEEPTPARAILAAGGAKEEAALARVRLVRSSLDQPLLLDLRANAPEKLPEPAKHLLPGDILVIPARQALVLGAIAGAGPVALRGGETLMDVVSVKGSERSDLSRVIVVRAKNVRAEKREMEEYNLTEYFDKDSDKVQAPVPIHDGDLVFVPEKGRSIFDGGIMGFLSVLSYARMFLFF